MTKTFFHSGDLGDIIASLPAIRQLGGGELIIGPHVGPGGPREAMTEGRANFLLPLINAQNYVKARYGEKPAECIDLSNFREKTKAVRNEDLASWHARHVGIADLDLTPWLHVINPRRSDRVVVARSGRYHNPVFPWKKYLDVKRSLFLGLESEHKAMVREWKVKLEHQQVRDALEMAEWIAGSKLFVGNQSSPMWIAMAMGHPLVQESCEECLNSRIKRDNAVFILDSPPRQRREPKTAQGPSAAQREAMQGAWRPTREASRKLVVALQFHPGDFQPALELAKLIAELEIRPRHDVLFLLFERDDVSHSMGDQVRAALSTKFEVRRMKSGRQGRGWPDGPNDLWQDCMVQLFELARREWSDIAGCGVLTMEPDCCPMRRDWLDILAEEWQAAQTEGKEACGCIGTGKGIVPHLNGNAIFAADIIRRHKALQASSGSWDLYHRRLLLGISRHTDTIRNLYQTSGYTSASLGAVFGDAVRTPAMIHGCKDGTIRELVKAAILAPTESEVEASASQPA